MTVPPPPHPARAPAGRSRAFVALSLAILVVAGYASYAAVWAPRPYYLTEMDAEQDYYYNARLIAAGLPTSVHHPGTPVYYLGYGLLKLAGDEPSQTQRFFDLGYAAIGLLAALGFVVFWRSALRDMPFSLSLGILGAVVAWPPFLAYLNFFNADAFVLTVGLVASAVFWRALAAAPPTGRRLEVIGAGCLGLCLAVKMSFIPFVIALGCGYAIHAWRDERRQGVLIHTSGTLKRATPRLTSIVLALVAGFLVGVLPVIGRVPFILARVLIRPDVGPQGSIGRDVADIWSLLTGVNPPLVVLAAMAVALFATGVAARVIPRRITTGFPTEDFDYPSAALALGLLLLGLLYTAAASAAISPGAEAGVRLRNISPTFLGIPLALLFGFQAMRSAGASARVLRATAAAIGICSVLAAATSLHYEMRRRREFIGRHTAAIAITRAWLDRLAEGPRRAAFWTESAQDYAGDASFHFWGNYRYADGRFDADLLARYPGLTFFSIRNLRVELKQATAPTSMPGPPSRFGRVGETYRAIARAAALDRETYKHAGVLAGGDGSAPSIAAIAVPTSEVEATSFTDTELLDAVRRRFGDAVINHELIAGVDWTVVSLRASATSLVRKQRSDE